MKSIIDLRRNLLFDRSRVSADALLLVTAIWPPPSRGSSRSGEETHQGVSCYWTED